MPHNRSHIHLPQHVGDRAADVVVAGMGSWRFVIIQTIIVGAWVIYNGGILTGVIPFDIYPFILLNLVFSTQAAYASPLILMASNRQASRDRVRDDLEASEVEELFQINKHQLEILNVLHGIQTRENKG